VPEPTTGWPASAGRRWLLRVSWAETASLLVLLANLATMHLPAVASAVGPVHGTLYLACIATTLLQPVPSSARWLSVVPAVGGWLALRRADRDDRRRAAASMMEG
jgi:hypothetical protein